jgi:hypothetical protein
MKLFERVYIPKISEAVASACVFLLTLHSLDFTQKLCHSHVEINTIYRTNQNRRYNLNWIYLLMYLIYIYTLSINWENSVSVGNVINTGTEDPLGNLSLRVKNVVFWDVALCRSCVKRWLPTAHAGSQLADLSTLMELIRSSETSVDARSTQHHILEDDILHSHRCESLKSF